jgi:hypothetical protein
MEFRLVISVSKVVIGGNVTYEAKEAKDYTAKLATGEDEVTDPTGLATMREEFYSKGATQEPVRKMIGNVHQQFQRLVEYFEAMTTESDFWKGIELPG